MKNDPDEGYERTDEDAPEDEDDEDEVRVGRGFGFTHRVALHFRQRICVPVTSASDSPTTSPQQSHSSRRDSNLSTSWAVVGSNTPASRSAWCRIASVSLMVSIINGWLSSSRLRFILARYPGS